MAELKNIAQSLKEKLAGAGLTGYAFEVTESEMRELNTEGSDFSLYRTIFDKKASAIAFIGGKKGSSSGNDFTEEGLAAVAEAAKTGAESAADDPANTLAEKQEPEVFVSGPQEPDMDGFYNRLEEFFAQAKEEFPKVAVNQIIAAHTKSHTIYENSNGTVFETYDGIYEVSLEFAGSDGEVTTGLGYCEVCMHDLDKPIMELGAIRQQLKDAEASLKRTQIGGKFEGTVIFTPDAAAMFTYMLADNFMSGTVVMDGTSLWLDKIGEKVASDCFTLRLAASDPRLAQTEPYTSDGYKAENVALIENGVLKAHMLDLYAANKTGRPVLKNTSYSMIIEPGDTPLADMIKNVKRGLIVGGFSGGHPGASGEFSGVAKNSFYVEDGEVKGAVMETMINGNLASVFSHIIAISREVVEDGSMSIPYIAAEGVMVSGKD